MWSKNISEKPLRKGKTNPNLNGFFLPPLKHCNLEKQVCQVEFYITKNKSKTSLSNLKFCGAINKEERLSKIAELSFSSSMSNYLIVV